MCINLFKLPKSFGHVHLHFDVMPSSCVTKAKKVEDLGCLFVFRWIELKFGVRGNLVFWFQILA